MPTSEKEIERIGDIIKNARGTWFVLLGSLVFAAITLASVKDVSFFITSEQTKLPLLGISVPITSFFWAGSLLVTAFYSYLHLYLEQLWDALGEADARIGDKPLADVIHPWLVSDAALRVRDKRRGDVRHRPAKRSWKKRWRRFRHGLFGSQYTIAKPFYSDQRRKHTEESSWSSRQRGMTLLSNIISIALVWGLGLVIIGWFWWRSMPAHDIWLTGWLGILLVWSMLVCWRSGGYALSRLGEEEVNMWKPTRIIAVVLVIGGLTVVRSHKDFWEDYPRMRIIQSAEDCVSDNKTPKEYKEELESIGLNLDEIQCPHFLYALWDVVRPARTNLREIEFSKKPQSWRGYNLLKQEFREIWCNKMLNDSCAINPFELDSVFTEEQENKFSEAWESRWGELLKSYGGTKFQKNRLDRADLWRAKLDGVALSNMDLRYTEFDEADMLNANMNSSDLRGAIFIRAILWDADFTEADLRNSNFSRAELIDAVFVDAQMQSADLTGARMQDADLTGAQMQSADLTGARMQDADLTGAQMQSADLTGARMQDADLSGAQMQGADLWNAQMQGANLSFAQMQGAVLRNAKMQGADLSGAEMQGADLSGAEMQGTPEKVMKLQSTNLSEGNFSGVSLRIVDFTEAVAMKVRNFDKSFGDGSVELAGIENKPNGWCEAVLSDAQYWGRYQGWLEKHDLGESFDSEITKHPLIPFSEPCPE